MTIFKNIKDGKLYMLYNSNDKDINLYIAIPYGHFGKSIQICKLSEFIPIHMSDIKISKFI